MLSFISRCVLSTIPLLWAVVTLVFISVHLLPGDGAQVMFERNGSA